MAMIAAITLEDPFDETWGVPFDGEREVTASGVPMAPAPDLTTLIVIEPPEPPAAVGYATCG